MHQPSPLPIDDFISEILQKFHSHKNLVLVAEPGAGKTTRVPPALLNISKKKILILEPRRMAAVAAASRISEEQNWKLGQELGYQVRFESQVSPSTRLIFMTEALLAKKILADPNLSDVDIVVLDEFHERSQHVDLALGLLKEAQELGSSVKILVMSATLDAQAVSRYLNDAPIVNVPGKSFPLDIRYDKNPQSLRTDDSFYRRLSDKIKEARQTTSQDVLVFLPGVGEINKASRFLEGSGIKTDHLHGSLSLDEQRRVLKKSAEPRVILSTNIAESSVTLDDVNVVIDCGLNKINSWNPDTGFDSLELHRVSKSSAAQRAGRAARQGPGTCFRLWNQQDELSMKPFTEPEISRVELSDALLWLSFLGVTDAKTFSWYQAPPAHHLEVCRNLLVLMKAIRDDGQITEKGRQLLLWPLDLRVACFLWEAQKETTAENAADLAAILQERDFWNQQYNLESYHEAHENDLYLRFELLSQLKKQKSVPGFALPLVRASQQIQKLTTGATQPVSPEKIQKWAMLSFPDRLCRRRNPQEAKALMATGRGVEVDIKSQVKKSEFFVALQGIDLSDKDTKISLACAITKDEIVSYFSDKIEKQRTLKQDKSGKVIVEEFKSYLKIPLEKPVIRPASPEEIQSLLPQIVLDSWDKLLSENEALNSWWQRWNYYVTQKGSSAQSTTKKWLAPLVGEGCYGLRGWEEVVRQDWVYFLEKDLDENTRIEFQKLVPAEIQVGHRSLKIQYQPGQDPFIEARIQNFFGLKKHPSIWNNQIPLRLILLGPHGRPIQITKDLTSFWKSSYPEVRKEMKADYPKHSWPEDPSSDS